MRAKTILIILFSICGIVVLIAAAALLLYRFNAKNRIMDGPDMVREDTFDFSSVYLERMEYYRGGGSLGDSFSLELTMEEGEEGRPDVRVEYYNRPSHDVKAVEKTVRMSSDVVTGVMEIIDRYGMRDWGELPEAEEFALDAPSMRFRCTYSDGSSITAGSGDELPDGGGAAIREIRDYVLRCAGLENGD